MPLLHAVKDPIDNIGEPRSTAERLANGGGPAQAQLAVLMGQHDTGLRRLAYRLLEDHDEMDDVGSVLAGGDGIGGGTAARRQHVARRPMWRRLGWVPVALAAGALLVVWTFGGLGPGGLAPGVASAAEIKAKVVSALAAVSSMRGTLVVTAADTDASGAATTSEMRWSFAYSSKGDLRLTGVTRKEDLAYDAARGAERVTSGGEADQPVVASEATGLAVGPPDPGPADWVLHRNLGSTVRALLAADDATVSATTYEGRPAWVLDTTVQRNRLGRDPAPEKRDRLQVTVDQESGFPVRSVKTRDGSLVEETRLEGLELDPVLPSGAFALTFPTGIDVGAFDNGFTRVRLEQVAGIVGYDPLLPADLPQGYVLAEVAVAKSSQPTGKEGMNPPSRGVVSLAYRRGLDRIVISTRLAGDGASLWTDPLASGEGYVDEPLRMVLAGGALDGAGAEVLIDPLVTPHLWARGHEVILTVSGDASRAELIRVAQSLTPPAD